MTDFGLHHAGRWKDGHGPVFSKSFYSVHYDQTTDVYVVSAHELDEFFMWVAWHFGPDDDAAGDGETYHQYLARIGCVVTRLDVS